MDPTCLYGPFKMMCIFISRSFSYWMVNVEYAAFAAMTIDIFVKRKKILKNQEEKDNSGSKHG